MTVSVFQAAKYLCEKATWRLTNLQIHKLLYIAHMFHLGDFEKPLIHEEFEAWAYGPVQPDLYHHAKVYGSSPVKNIFHTVAPIADSQETKYLDEVVNQFSSKSPSWLVAATHWDKGAWAKNYRSNSRGVKIPNSDILQEFKDRESNAKRRREQQQSA